MLPTILVLDSGHIKPLCLTKKNLPPACGPCLYTSPHEPGTVFRIICSRLLVWTQIREVGLLSISWEGASTTQSSGREEWPSSSLLPTKPDLCLLCVISGNRETVFHNDWDRTDTAPLQGKSPGNSRANFPSQESVPVLASGPPGRHIAWWGARPYRWIPAQYLGK